MRKLLKYLKHYKAQSILAPLFKLLEALFELFVPLVVAAIIDNGINGGAGVSYVVYACLILVALGVIGLISAVSAQYFAAKAAVGFSKELRHDLFAKMQSLSYSRIDGLGTGKMITRMTSDVNQLQSGVNLVLRLFMRSPFIVFGAMIMAFIVDPSGVSGGVFGISIAVLCVIVFGIMLASIPLYKKVQGKLDKVTTATRETLTGARVLRAFCKEEDEVSEYNKKNAELTKVQLFVGKISALMNPLTYAVINAAIIILLYVGAIKIDGGTLSQGQVVSLYNYMSQILIELIKLANLIITVTKSFACAGRITEILDMESESVHGWQTVEKVADKGVPFIEYKNVSVNYGDAQVNALDNISFSVERGQTVGIIGGTGAGKTTLVNVLPHFYDVREGQVLIDGVNVNGIGDEALRDKCGIVPQRAVLFKGTIRENMQWGKNDASDEEISEAVAAAQASDVIRAKDGGLDEPVEQGGKNFSGGQRQRLTIARALVKKPEILILDDSASALDYATDAALRKSLKNLEYKPTVFIVSQRTSSIRHADKIIVLDGGKMVGLGTHDELLKSCEVYREINNSQFGQEEAQNG